MLAGELDVALIPSIEYFRDPRYEIISDACVATRGAVLSVKLFSRVHPGRIRRLALDAGSRTSSTLVQIILAEKYGVFPELETLPMEMHIVDSTADAVLLIGDRAMQPPSETFHEVWDLGTEWKKWTGLPFVFAMWVARNDCDLQGVDAALCQARDAGLKNLEGIARDEAATVGISQEQCLSYLRDNLYFHLGPRQRRGLELFYRHAAALGLAPADLDLRLDDCQATR